MLRIVFLFFVLVSCVSKDRALSSKPFFDHTYIITEDKNDFFKLEKRGFTLSKKPVSHPGIQSRFIGFTGLSYPPKQYLEWGHTKDIKKLIKKNSSDPMAISDTTGLGFLSKKGIEEYIPQLQERFPENKVIFVHRNFNWEKNSKDRLPGWNFLAFEKKLIDDISVFGVEYELDKPRKVKLVEHANGTQRIIGAIIDLSPLELEKLDRFSSGYKKNGILSDDYGFHFLSFSSLGELQRVFKHKRHKYKAVILKAADMKLFKKIAKPDYEVRIKGELFYGIKTPAKAWDILVTGDDSSIRALRDGRELFSDAELKWNKKIRVIYNGGNYEKSLEEAKKFFKSYPNSLLAKYNYSVQHGDLAYSKKYSESLRKQWMDIAKEGISDLCHSDELKDLPEHFRQRVQNEYFWFFKKHKEQYEHGKKLISLGARKGHYSATVGAAMKAKKNILQGSIKEGESWARKALLHFREFEKYNPDWHNINYFSSLAYACLGQYEKAKKTFRDMYKKSKKKEDASEVKQNMEDIEKLRKARIQSKPF